MPCFRVRSCFDEARKTATVSVGRLGGATAAAGDRQRLAFRAVCVDDTYLAAWLQLGYSDARKWQGIHCNRATTS